MTTKILEALRTTVFGMGLVLGTLYLLSLILDLMRVIFAPKTLSKDDDQAIKEGQDEMLENISHNAKEREAELIAVITAALSEYMSKPIYQIKVNSIRQIHTKTPLWGMRSRLRNLNNRF